MKESAVHKARRWDAIVLAVIFSVVALVLVLSFALRRPGAVAVVEVNGQTVGEYALDTDGTFVLNGGTNTLVIEGGEAFVINSDCPDRTCEHTGRVRFVGQSIVCLPNRLSVTIRGDAEGGVDLVS
jgi:hypothetical protein